MIVKNGHVERLDGVEERIRSAACIDCGVGVGTGPVGRSVQCLSHDASPMAT
jgi:hypothetical protein